jgi:chromosomal replication initiation ATPase DnaA
MEHVINANYGDTIVIKIPNRPMVVEQKITLPTEVEVKVNYNAIISDVCASLGITLQDIQGKSKKSEIVTARFYTANKLREYGLSYSIIGRLLHRDHASIMHAVRTYQARLEYQDTLTMDIVNIVKQYEAAKG